MRARFQWNTGRRRLALGERTLVMGVVNVTPDSFSDGGRYFSPEAALAHAVALLDAGADILDIGGESTRPGTPVAAGASPRRGEAVSAEQEISRVLPVVEALRRERPEAVVSIDTYKSEVARAALDAGAEIVNDVSGLTWDEPMSALLASRRCGVILMHTRGTPAEWASLPPLADPAALVGRELAARAAAARAAGIAPEAMVLDPGFGFGKRGEENYRILARMDELQALGFPLAVGLSRKGFLARTLAGRNPAGEAVAMASRDAATLAASVAAALAGAHIVRVHAVRAAVEAVAIADAILAARQE